MRVPHFLFPVINPLMAGVLQSPIHRLASSSVLLLSFKGRRSGRYLRMPLRYLPLEDELHCFTTEDARWWRNFEQPTPVDTLVRGEWIPGTASARRVAPGEALSDLRSFLTRYPSDAVYHGVTIDRGLPSNEDLDRTIERSIQLKIRATGLRNGLSGTGGGQL